MWRLRSEGRSKALPHTWQGSSGRWRAGRPPLTLVAEEAVASGTRQGLMTDADSVSTSPADDAIDSDDTDWRPSDPDVPPGCATSTRDTNDSDRSNGLSALCAPQPYTYRNKHSFRLTIAFIPSYNYTITGDKTIDSNTNRHSTVPIHIELLISHRITHWISHAN